MLGLNGLQLIKPKTLGFIYERFLLHAPILLGFIALFIFVCTAIQ